MFKRPYVFKYEGLAELCFNTFMFICKVSQIVFNLKAINVFSPALLPSPCEILKGAPHAKN